MRLKIAFLSCLLAIPCQAFPDSPTIDFLRNFENLYEKYHFGKHLPPKEVAWIGAEIWLGSGKDYLFASTVACQCICETHWEAQHKAGMYLGHIGMKRYTVFVEAVRLGICKNNRKARLKLWAYCKKNPCYADYLAASRVVYLTSVYKSRRIALFQYVEGESWHFKQKSMVSAQVYWNTVERLRLKNFY
jgi:hypothetical protein